MAFGFWIFFEIRILTLGFKIVDLYQANILEHYKHPHRRGKLESPTAHNEHANPLCGDRVEIYLLVDKGKIADAKFSGEGCVLSQAASSILMDELIGKNSDDVKKWSAEKILDMLKIKVGPNRLKCASLSLDSVQAALKKV